MLRGFELTGYRQAMRAFGKARTDVAPRILDAVTSAAEKVLERARYYVPKDSHRLEEEAEVVAEGAGLHAVARVIFWTWYAVYVHEVLTYAHDPPTCAKYLERATRELRGTLTAMIQRQFEAKRSAF